MRIDSHQHFWRYNPVRDGWINTAMGAIRKDFLPVDLKSILIENKFEGCVAVQADQSEDETRFLLKLAHENPFIKGVVGWVDLCADNVERRLDYFSKFNKFCGVRHIVQAEPLDFMLRQDFQLGISKLKQFELTYDILVHTDQLPEVIEIVKTFPKQSFVIDHMAKPNIKDGEINTWKQNLEVLATFQNVSCKVSGMVTEATWNKWSEDDFTQYLDVIFNTFGTDRLMFGSDWPVCLLSADYTDVVKIVENYCKNLSQLDMKKIMGLNAIKFYNLAI